MSMEALLLAVRDRLRTECDYADAQCDVQPDGRVPPPAGQVYVSVHPAGFRNTAEYDLGLDEAYDVTVTLTMRAGWLPRDRVGTQQTARPSAGLYARAAAIRAALHMAYAVTAAANEAIGDDENGFVEPLRFSSCSAPQEKGPEWFGAEGDATPAAGYAVELRFVGARRVQVIEEQS